MSMNKQISAMVAVHNLINELDPPPEGKKIEVSGGVVDVELKTVIFDYRLIDKEPT